jgi:hypothetical protein
MARTTVSNVRSGGGGSLDPSFLERDEQALLAQTNAVGTRLIDVIVQVEIENIPANTEVTAKIAIDEFNAQLEAQDNLVALPCPPYCGKDGLSSSKTTGENSTEIKSKKSSFWGKLFKRSRS